MSDNLAFFFITNEYASFPETRIPVVRDLKIIPFFALNVLLGETSAGKSTFINLLLGVELLPQSPLTCTSPICRISNRDHKKIVLTDNDNKQETVIVPKHQISEDMKNLLKDYICASKAGEKYKAVDICWPIPCLQVI